MPKAITTSSFDYGQLSGNEAAELRASADWVRNCFERTSTEVRERSREMGLRLIAARQILGHGRFLPWLEAEFPFSRRTAYRMIDCAERLPADKLAIVANLPDAVVYQLVAPTTPEEFRVSVLDRSEPIAPAEVENIATSLEDERRLAREKEKRRRQTSRLPAAERKAKLQAEARRERQDQRERELYERQRQERRAAASAAVAMLVESLGETLPAFLEKAELARGEFDRMLHELWLRETGA